MLPMGLELQKVESHLNSVHALYWLGVLGTWL